METKIRVGIVLPDKHIAGREMIIKKPWKDISPQDILPLLNKGEWIHGYCLLEEKEDK